MSVVAIPTAASRRIPVWLILTLLLLVGAGGYLVYARIDSASSGTAFVGNYQPAQVMDLDVRLTKDGELHAVNNIEVINRVEGINTIQELVKEGTFVHKGDKLVVLDSSNIQKAYDQSLLDLQNAESAVSNAKETKEIQEATNKANIEAAKLDLEVSQIELEEYTRGMAPQAEEEARTKLRMAEIMLKNKEEDLVITRNLFAKGFVTAVDVKKGELDVLTCQNELKKAETALKVLIDFTHQKNLATKKSAVAQAEQKVERTRRENQASMNKLTAALDIIQQSYNLRQQLTTKLKETLENCTITAPADGLVVYASSSERLGLDQIKEGGNVRLSQVLLRLPDTSAMKAVIRVQEGQVGKLRVDDNNPMRATVQVVGFKRPFGASVSKISVLADSSQRYWNPDLKEYPVELLLDETPANCKPGLGATVEILMDRRHQVIGVPLTSIYSQGNQSFVFVRGANSEPTPVEVKIGVTNDTHAEILTGLTAGQDVLLLQPGQGRQLLEKAGIKLLPTTRPGDMGKPKRGNRNSPTAVQGPDKRPKSPS